MKSQKGCTAVVSHVRTKSKPKRELRRAAPQLSFGFYVLIHLATVILHISSGNLTFLSIMAIAEVNY